MLPMRRRRTRGREESGPGGRSTCCKHLAVLGKNGASSWVKGIVGGRRG
jgi:hypothetical protein